MILRRRSPVLLVGRLAPRTAPVAVVRRNIAIQRHRRKEAAMKGIMSGLITAAVVATASVTPCGAVPMAQLSGVSLETAVQNVAWRHRPHHRHVLIYVTPGLEVGPGLYYGCRPGWYCFGPPYRASYARAWYGGFNSTYGYQGARWRPPQRSTETTNTPVTIPPTNTPPATTPPRDQETTPGPGR